MRIPKRYGQSRTSACPFCGKQGITHNDQGIPVCNAHRSTRLPDIRCVCGEWLEVATGRFGPYFRCLNCGNINFRRGLEMAGDLTSPAAEETEQGEKKDKKDDHSDKHRVKKAPTETVITSQELDLL
ncbi:MAG: hypothetical protein GXP63_04880 [DPANN group archaeon]|nr:hypothetical protein [DPANN group archaeon]